MQRVSIEWLTGLGIVAYGLLAFSLAVRYLRLVDHSLVLMEEHAAQVSQVVEESARP